MESWMAGSEAGHGELIVFVGLGGPYSRAMTDAFYENE
jgi:hypothetical protein